MSGFPGLGLLRVLRPIPAASTGDGSSPRPAGRWPDGGPSGWFPRSLLTARQGWCPALPLQHRHDYAAVLHRGLRVGDFDRPRSYRHDSCRMRAALQPISARFELVGSLRGFISLVPHVHLSVSLAGPRPSGSAGLSRRLQGCFPPSPSSQGSGCPVLQPARCDEPTTVPFITARSGTPRGARSRWPRRGSGIRPGGERRSPVGSDGACGSSAVCADLLAATGAGCACG